MSQVVLDGLRYVKGTERLAALADLLIFASDAANNVLEICAEVAPEVKELQEHILAAMSNAERACNVLSVKAELL